jgi:hypothetical protein
MKKASPVQPKPSIPKEGVEGSGKSQGDNLVAIKAARAAAAKKASQG